MANLTFEIFWPLLFLLLLPYLWWARRGTAVDLTARHIQLATIVRSAIVCVLALALMQPVLYLSGNSVSVVYLLDISRSVAPAAIQEAIAWVRQTHEAGAPEHAQFVAFGSNALQFDDVESLTKVQVAYDAGDGVVGQSGTDIAAALNRAIRSFAPNHLRRVVLLSDGNGTAADASDVLPRLLRENARVFTVPMATRADGDAWIESVLAPSTVTAGEQFPVEVHVYSQFETDAGIELRNGEEVLGIRQVRLAEGINRIAFDTRIEEETSTAVLSAVVNAAEDRFADNDVFRQPVVISGHPRILYVESHNPSAQYLQGALTIEGLLVDVVDPRQVPVSAAALDRYAAIVMSDVYPLSLTTPQMAAVETYVRELGGGFILTGGENTYGQDGYTDTPIERALPVTFETRKKPPTIAMAVVIDVSGSMGGGRLTIAKEAARAPLSALRDSDRFGVLSFNTGFNWVAPMQLVAGRSTISAQIESLASSGGTNVYVGLNAAFEALRNAPDELKMVLLLTDGLTPPTDLRGLTTNMLSAGINVSSVAVGQASNRELLADIAMWGKGRAYYIDSFERVPQVFIKEAELAVGKTLQEQPFLAIVQKEVEALKGIDFDTAPRLLGYVATRAKPTAEIILVESWTGEPLLARWQYGLGKTAAFTSDVKARWSSEWIEWSGYPKFWAQVVREIMRRPDDPYFDFKVVREGDSAIMSINAMERDGRFRNALQPQVRVIAPDQQISVINIPQVGPGAYEAVVPIDQDGSYVFRASAEDASAPTRLLEFSYPAEFRFHPPDIDSLEAISAATGGTFQPAGPEIFDTYGETVQYPVRLWPWLAAMGLILYVVDILLRRLRLFEGAPARA